MKSFSTALAALAAIAFAMPSIASAQDKPMAKPTMQHHMHHHVHHHMHHHMHHDMKKPMTDKKM
jgi:hypothetical protein